MAKKNKRVRAKSGNQMTLLDYIEIAEFERETERLSRIADAIDLILPELGTATAMTLQRELKQRFNIEATLDDIDEAIDILVGMYPDKYMFYRRSGHKGIRMIPNPKLVLPPKVEKLVEELLQP